MTVGALRERQLSDIFPILLMILLAAGVLLRFYQPGAQSFWLDELWTAAASDPRLSLSQWMEKWVLTDVHPPLYSLLMREWRVLFGDSEVSMRFPSALLSLCLVAAVPLFNRWTPIVREPLMLTAWFACSAGAIVFAQEARPYTLLLLLSAVATLLGVAIALRLERGEPVLGPLCALASVVIVAEYSHYFGALMGLGIFGALFLFAAAWHRRHLLPITLSGVAAGSLLLPWLMFHASHISDKLRGDFWITNDWSKSFSQVAGLAVGSSAACLLIATAIVGTLIACPRLLRRPACFVPLLSMALVLLGAMAISLHTPVVTDRNLLILLPPFYVLATTVLTEAFATAQGRIPLASRVTSVAVIAASLVFAGHQVIMREKDQWREAAAKVASLPSCRDMRIQVYFWPEEIYAYYLPSPLRDNIRTVAIKPDDPGGQTLTSAPGERCPLIVWSGHMIGDYLVDLVADRLGISRDRVAVLKTRGNMLLLDRDRLIASGKQRDAKLP